MIFTPIPLAGCYVIQLTPNNDDRGWFARTYCKREFSQIGYQDEWAQMNHSFTLLKGTIRGLHYQLPPHKETKLVRCVRGRIFDVVVDIRKGSPTFLKWHGIELSESLMNMLYIPEGFAHGFQTLTDECQLLYNHSAFYEPDSEAGIRYNDPLLNIRWPLELTVISDRDNDHELLLDNFKGI